MRSLERRGSYCLGNLQDAHNGGQMKRARCSGESMKMTGLVMQCDIDKGGKYGRHFTCFDTQHRRERNDEPGR